MSWSLVRGTQVATLLVFVAGVTTGCGDGRGRGVDVRQSAASATPAFVQVAAATPQSAQAAVTVTYAAAQAASDLNVVIVGWTDATSTITGVTDSSGNAYALAVGPTRRAGAASQSMYYAKGIAAAAAGANVVTVRFNGAVPFPDVRI